jgi:hypothetical protein
MFFDWLVMFCWLCFIGYVVGYVVVGYMLLAVLLAMLVLIIVVSPFTPL